MLVYACLDYVVLDFHVVDCIIWDDCKLKIGSALVLRLDHV